MRSKVLVRLWPSLGPAGTNSGRKSDRACNESTEKMARPKKRAFERRCEPVKCDVTFAEKYHVRKQAAAEGLSVAEFARRRVLRATVKAASSGSRFDPALVSEINRLGNQLAALGNLANQIALYCHTDRRIPDSWETLPNEIKALQRLVERTLEKVVLAHGS